PPPRRRQVATLFVISAVALLTLVFCLLPLGLIFGYLFVAESPPAPGRAPRYNLSVIADDPRVKVEVAGPGGGIFRTTGDAFPHYNFNLAPGDYQVRALKNDALVFQQWVALRPDVQQKVRVRFEEGWVQLFNSWDLTGW